MWVPGAQVEAQSKLLEEKARGAQEMASELEVGPRAVCGCGGAPGREAVKFGGVEQRKLGIF